MPFGVQYEGLRVDGNSDMFFTVTSAEEVTATKELTIRIVPASDGDNRGVDPNRSVFDNVPRVPNFQPGSGSDSSSGLDPLEPPIIVPDDNEPLGQSSSLGVDIAASQQQISAARGEEAAIRFRITNNDSFPHDNVDLTLMLPQGLVYSRLDFQNSGLSTSNQVFAGVDLSLIHI